MGTAAATGTGLPSEPSSRLATWIPRRSASRLAHQHHRKVPTVRVAPSGIDHARRASSTSVGRRHFVERHGFRALRIACGSSTDDTVGDLASTRSARGLRGRARPFLVAIALAGDVQRIPLIDLLRPWRASSSHDLRVWLFSPRGEKDAVVLFLALAGGRAGRPREVDGREDARPGREDRQRAMLDLSPLQGRWRRGRVGRPRSSRTSGRSRGRAPRSPTHRQSRRTREKALSEDLKKHMPRFDKEVSPADVDVVARWTRTRARSTARRCDLRTAELTHDEAR